MEVYPLQLTALRSSAPDQELPIQLSIVVRAGSPGCPIMDTSCRFGKACAFCSAHAVNAVVGVHSNLQCGCLAVPAHGPPSTPEAWPGSYADMAVIPVAYALPDPCPGSLNNEQWASVPACGLFRRRWRT